MNITIFSKSHFAALMVGGVIGAGGAVQLSEPGKSVERVTTRVLKTTQVETKNDALCDGLPIDTLFSKGDAGLVRRIMPDGTWVEMVDFAPGARVEDPSHPYTIRCGGFGRSVADGWRWVDEVDLLPASLMPEPDPEEIP